MSLRIEPVSAARWADLQQVFGERGAAAACQCQRAILPLRTWWYMPEPERKRLMQREVKARPAPGLVAYLDGEPVGWVRVGPRCKFASLRNSPVPWKGRREDKDDTGVWSIMCFAIRAGYRKRGLTYPLAAAAVAYARKHGATAIEGYPMVTGPADIPWGELKVGAEGAFRAAGFDEVTHPSKRRLVMRIDFGAAMSRRARSISLKKRRGRGTGRS